MRNPKARETAWTGMLFALAIALSWLESMVSPLLGLMPAIKLGLSNIVVMYALLFLRTRTAVLLVVLKALFAFLTRGVFSFLMRRGAGAGRVSFAVASARGQRVHILHLWGAGAQPRPADGGSHPPVQRHGACLCAGAAGGRADRWRHQLRDDQSTVHRAAQFRRAAAEGESL